MSWFLILLNIMEAASCIAGFLFYQKLKNTYWRWFPFYLGIISITEIVAEYYSYELHNLKMNNDIYRFFGLPFEFLFLFWLFYKYFNIARRDKWPQYAAIIYLACLVTDLLFVGKMKLFFDSFSYTVGNILLLILLIRFFLIFVKSDEILEYRSSMMFWVSVGLLIFYLGSLPFYGLRTTLYYQYPNVFYAYWCVQFILNYLMSSLFIVSFIWGKPK